MQSHSKSQIILCTNLPLTLQTYIKHITKHCIIIFLNYNYEISSNYLRGKTGLNVLDVLNVLNVLPVTHTPK